MCDYSLQGVDTRPAKKGDQLVLARFRGTPTRGFASPDAPNVAVCLLEGAELAIEAPPHRQTWLQWLLNLPPQPVRNVVVGSAKFAQINKGADYMHHDALSFLDRGGPILLQDIPLGTRARVLQLPVDMAKKSAMPVDQRTESPAPAA